MSEKKGGGLGMRRKPSTARGRVYGGEGGWLRRVELLLLFIFMDDYRNVCVQLFCMVCVMHSLDIRMQ